MAQNPQQAQPQGFGSRVASALGDLTGYFKSPDQLSPIQVPQQQVPQQPPQGQQGPTGQQQQQRPAGSTNGGATNDPETLQNPLDVYKGLFDNTPKKDKDGKVIAPPEPPSFKLDSKTISDAASKIDFMSGLPAEVTQKLQSGQIDAEVLQAVVSHVGQNSYARAMEHASTLTDRFVGMRLGHEQQGLQAQMNKLLARNHAISNPAIRDNPVLREHYETVSTKLAEKFPDQPPEWIAEQTNKYFTDMAMAVNPQLGQQQQSQDQGVRTNSQGALVKGDKVFDWQAYLQESSR